MSMTSTVSPILRQQIINVLTPSGIQVSNRYLEFRTNYAFSLRKIQEATQKLTRDGLLTKKVYPSGTYYMLSAAMKPGSMHRL
jgi:hypothetical protein